MKFVLSPSPDQGASDLCKLLVNELEAGKRVLWLIAGGSNISVSAEIMDNIPDHLTSNLTLSLTDERYGPIGHNDSNWEQLISAGFDPKQATPVPILTGQPDMAATVEAYAVTFETLLVENEVVIGQFGMGPDGHIAGILPHSPAVNASGLITGYHSETFERITGTFTAIKRCNPAYLFAFGDEKKPALQHLQTAATLADQPAQILRQIPDVYIYNDQIGEQV